MTELRLIRISRAAPSAGLDHVSIRQDSSPSATCLSGVYPTGFSLSLVHPDLVRAALVDRRRGRVLGWSSNLRGRTRGPRSCPQTRTPFPLLLYRLGEHSSMVPSRKA